jgi:site-specific DNA recombinase
MDAILYAAKSTADPRGSIPTQLADCRALAERERWQVTGEYRDEAFSAYSSDRGPGLARAIAECEQLAKERGACALIVQHSDRLARGNAREAKHLVEYALWAIKAGVTIRSVQDPEMFPEGEMALLLASVGGMRNYQDSKRKAAAVKGGMRRRAERGKLCGGMRPYGYDWTGAKGEKNLVVNKREAEVVRRMFQATLAGMSQRSLARRLTDEGITTATGKPWCQGTVGKILANPIYTGQLRHGGETFQGDHEAIVDEDVFERAKAIRASTARKPGGHWPKGQHLCTKGLLRCTCGYAMTPRTNPGRKTYEVYECSGRRQRGVDFCDQPTLPRHVVDEAIMAQLLNGYIDLERTRHQIEERISADLVHMPVRPSTSVRPRPRRSWPRWIAPNATTTTAT